jgi:hypothetical protein
MRIPLRTLIKARRQALRKASPKSRDQARHKVKVAEMLLVLRKEGKA